MAASEGAEVVWWLIGSIEAKLIANKNYRKERSEAQTLFLSCFACLSGPVRLACGLYSD
jgi:hypothetical protein